MSDPRDTSPAWAIVELTLGVLIAVIAVVAVWEMVFQPSAPLLFENSDRFLLQRAVEGAKENPFGWMASLFCVGAGIIAHAVYLLRRRTRVFHTAAAGTRPTAPGGPERPAVPRALQVLPGVGYRSFVAWRYLLVFHHRITTRTKIALVVLLAARIVLLLGFDVGMRFNSPGDPMQMLAAVTGTAFTLVLFFGVLRYSKLATFVYVFGFVLVLLCGTIDALAAHGKLPLDGLQARQIQQVVGITAIFGGIVAFLAAFFGTLRGFFTFFTTVPIGGVWIGTSALVLVLAVMSGFETDLRDKILGSNAHIQVTKEDGDFVEWRAVKTKIDNIPGVVASTPYAVSEVVIAANNNGMNVIIKGIDPDTVGNVTDLVNDLEEKELVCGGVHVATGTDTAPKCAIGERKGRCVSAALKAVQYLPESDDCDNDQRCAPCVNEAMARLEPLIDLGHDRTVPVAPKPVNAPDPAPDDMVRGGDPIDFSDPDAGSGSAGSGSAGSGSAGSGSAGSGSGSGSGSARAGAGSATSKPAGSGSNADGDTVPISPYGGDATRVIGSDTEAEVLDMLDSDLIRWMVGDQLDLGIHAVDVPTEPSLTRRTQALPGILVGRELVKQTHLYTGEEVRVVSPLSDPSNPDATGTPIPFNRDYRVAGVFYTGMYEYDLKFVYVTLDSLQDFLDLGDTVDGIEVRIDSGDDTDRYVREGTGDDAGLIRKALGPGYRVQDWRELNRSLFSALKLEKIAMFLVLGIVILVASFSIIGNLIMVVVEKGREIALLKTLGASDTGVMQMFAVQGMIIGLIGTFLGISFGLLGCLAMEKFGLPLDPDVYYINRLPIHVDPQSVLAAACTGVLISIAATLYPALMAARVRPAIGMRH